MSDVVKVIKLNSGEEIIAELQETLNKSEFKVVNPLLLLPQQDQKSGNFGISILPFAMGVKDSTFLLKETSTTYIADPSEAMLKQYNTVFSRVLYNSPEVIVLQ